MESLRVQPRTSQGRSLPILVSHSCALFYDISLITIALFQKYRYLLPTFLAGIILSCGAVLACFLSWDGGVRRGPRIALPAEKTETENVPAEIERSVSPVPSHHATIRTIKNKRSMILSPGIEESTGMSTSVKHNRRDSRASLGTAYG